MAAFGWEAVPRVPRYLLTGGRTEADLSLRLESQVRAKPGAVLAGLAPEQRRLAELCQEGNRSVIELAGTVQLPAPVVMVIVSDLLLDGVLGMAVPPPGGDRTALLDACLANLQMRWGVTAGAGR
ncbi:DUF742 domain-containing protein [Streptomyces sp. NPDC055078]